MSTRWFFFVFLDNSCSILVGFFTLVWKKIWNPINRVHAYTYIYKELHVFISWTAFLYLKNQENKSFIYFHIGRIIILNFSYKDKEKLMSWPMVTKGMPDRPWISDNDFFSTQVRGKYGIIIASQHAVSTILNINTKLLRFIFLIKNWLKIQLILECSFKGC